MVIMRFFKVQMYKKIGKENTLKNEIKKILNDKISS